MKFLYISKTKKNDVLEYQILKEFNSLFDLRNFIENIKMVLEPLHQFDKSSDSMLFYNYDASRYLDELVVDDKALANWYSLRELNNVERVGFDRLQTDYSIYTEEQFERQKKHLEGMGFAFTVTNKTNINFNF